MLGKIIFFVGVFVIITFFLILSIVKIKVKEKDDDFYVDDDLNIKEHKLKPKKYSNCINGIDFRLENTKLTRKNIIYEEII